MYASSLTDVTGMAVDAIAAGAPVTEPVVSGVDATDPIDAVAAEVYRYAERAGEIGSLDSVASELDRPVFEVCTAVARLFELRLLRADDTDPDRLRPADPDLALAELVIPLERESYRRREVADRVRSEVEQIAQPRCGSIDGLSGADEIRGLFRHASDGARHEVLVLRPSDADDDCLDDLLAPCYAVLGRDVTLRIICPHSTRAGFDTRAKAKRLVQHGAEIRTRSQVRQTAVVFDRSVAVTLTGVGADETDELAARRVRDPDVVRFLVDLFDQLWEGGTPVADSTPGYGDAFDNLQQSIVRLMAQGFTDEVVARKLGMSVRTCRRHIAALLHELDAVSRFQAGVQAARQGGLQSALGH